MDHISNYVSVLRWKAAERDALFQLKEESKAFITPLIEFVPKHFEARSDRSPSSPSDLMRQTAEDIGVNWKLRTAWIDFRYAWESLGHEEASSALLSLAGEVRQGKARAAYLQIDGNSYL
jgi:hypothetical protein